MPRARDSSAWGGLAALLDYLDRGAKLERTDNLVVAHMPDDAQSVHMVLDEDDVAELRQLAAAGPAVEKLVLEDLGLWGLLHGREEREQRLTSLMRRLADATEGVPATSNLRLVVQVRARRGELKLSDRGGDDV